MLMFILVHVHTIFRPRDNEVMGYFIVSFVLFLATCKSLLSLGLNIFDSWAFFCFCLMSQQAKNAYGI